MRAERGAHDRRVAVRLKRPREFRDRLPTPVSERSLRGLGATDDVERNHDGRRPEVLQGLREVDPGQVGVREDVRVEKLRKERPAFSDVRKERCARPGDVVDLEVLPLDRNVGERHAAGVGKLLEEVRPEFFKRIPRFLRTPIPKKKIGPEVRHIGRLPDGRDHGVGHCGAEALLRLDFLPDRDGETDFPVDDFRVETQRGEVRLLQKRVDVGREVGFGATALQERPAVGNLRGQALQKFAQREQFGLFVACGKLQDGLLFLVETDLPEPRFAENGNRPLDHEPRIHVGAFGQTDLSHYQIGRFFHGAPDDFRPLFEAQAREAFGRVLQGAAHGVNRSGIGFVFLRREERFEPGAIAPVRKVRHAEKPQDAGAIGRLRHFREKLLQDVDRALATVRVDEKVVEREQKHSGVFDRQVDVFRPGHGFERVCEDVVARFRRPSGDVLEPSLAIVLYGAVARIERFVFFLLGHLAPDGFVTREERLDARGAEA